MKHTPPIRHTIRFRRWSRKNYAAFASIGRCVTIGCLRKGVADSSLSKQKTAGVAGHAGCESKNPWKGVTECREPDSGIPPENEALFMLGIIGSGISLQQTFQRQAICPYANTGKQKEYILIQKNNSGMDYLEMCGQIIDHTFSGNPCFFN